MGATSIVLTQRNSCKFFSESDPPPPKKKKKKKKKEKRKKKNGYGPLKNSGERSRTILTFLLEVLLT